MQVRYRHHIAIVATISSFGGAERVIAETVANIDRSRFLITPILFTQSDNSDSFLTRRFQSLKQMYYLLNTDAESIALLNPLRNIIALRKLLSGLKVNMIHSHGYRADVIAGLAAWDCNIPLVTTCHGFIQSSSKMALYKSISGLFLRRFARVMVVSEALRQDIVDIGVDADRTVLLPNAIQIPDKCSDWHHTRGRVREWYNVQDGFLIGYVGRLSQEKGLEYLLKSVSSLANEKVPIKVLIIGDGPDRSRLERMSADLQLDRFVHFTGFQDRVSQWLSALDVFVLPSTTEGTPMALLEAMAHGVPVVATSVGGVPSIVRDGIEGLLVKPRDPEDILNAIRRICHENGLASQLSTQAQARIAKEYNMNSWIKNIQALYDNVIGHQIVD